MPLQPDHVSVWPVAEAPRLVRVDPPRLSPSVQERVHDERARMADGNGFIDSPLLMVAQATPHELAVFPATFA